MQNVLSIEPQLTALGLKIKDHTSIRLDKTRYGGIVHIWPKILRPKTRRGMIDIHIYAQSGDRWRFKYSDPELDEVPRHQILIDFPASSGISLGEIFGYRFPISVHAENYLINANGRNWRTPLGYKEHLVKHDILTGTSKKT